MTARPTSVRHQLWAAVAMIAATSLTACDSDRRAISRDDLPEVPAEPDIEVTVDDEGFSLAVLDVDTEMLVRFVVTEGEHRIRTDTGIDTGVILPGETTDIVFDEAGVHRVTDSEAGDHELVVTATAAEAAGEADVSR